MASCLGVEIFCEFLCSGVTLLEGARGQKWLGAPLIKKRFGQSAKNREPCGVDVALEDPGGVQGGQRPRKLSSFSMQKQHFQYKIIYIRLLGGHNWVHFAHRL